jgi:hypothetical protein
MERFMHWLTYSGLPVLGRLFGLPPLLIGYDPAVQQSIMSGVERDVYGAEGLAGYEARCPDELARLARRTLAQYRCQQALHGSWSVRALRGVLFVIALPVVLTVLLGRTVRDRRRLKSQESAEVVVFVAAERVRAMAAAAFEGWRIHFHTDRPVRLGFAELRFLARAIVACPAYLWSPGLLLSLLRWLALYGHVVTARRPRVLANLFEGTAATSLLTAYLHGRGVLHVNLMHGEMFFSADCAFAEFDRFFVWGRHFEELFQRLGAPAGRLAISGSPDHRALFLSVRDSAQPRPRSLLVIHNSLVMRADYAELQPLLRVLALLSRDWIVRVRCHPAANATHAAYVAALRADPAVRRSGVRIEEEPFASIALPDALRRSRVVAGVYSTALLEGWVAGCKVLYLPGVIARDAVLPRHGGSPNVIYLDQAVSDARVAEFIETPAQLDSVEAERVDRVTRVLHLGERFAPGAEGQIMEMLSA